MISGFGKQSISIGSSPSSEIRLGGPGVQPAHARIERKANGALVLINGASGSTRAGGEALGPNAEHAFDFRTSFTLGEGSPLPLTHPALTLMLLSRGQAAPSSGEIRIGRDPARNDIVVQHPIVSGQHANLSRSPLSITDRGSSSGTFLDQAVRVQQQHVAGLEPAGAALHAVRRRGRQDARP